MPTLKEQLDKIWNRPGVINNLNINKWNDSRGYKIADGLFVAKGRKVTLNIKYHVKFQKTPTYLCKWYGSYWYSQFNSNSE